MMFSRVAALAIVSAPLLAAATPLEVRGGGSSGTPLCCKSVEKASSAGAGVILGLLGIVLQDLNVLVGISCSPITVIGVGSGDCSSTTVTCTDNSHGNLISIGCIPITL